MLQKFCETTSCNGIIDLYEARHHKCRFLFWTLVMTVMTSACVFFTYTTIKSYFDTPKVTNVQCAYKKALDMPEVLICYNGGMNISSMLATGFSADLIKVFIFKDKVSPSQGSHEELLNYTSSKNISMKDVYQQFSYTCDQLVEDFSIPGFWGLVTRYQPCKAAETLWTPSGNCYLFKNNRQQVFPGNGGMEIKLKAIPTDPQVAELHRGLVNIKYTKDFSISLEKSFGRQVSGRTIAIPLQHYATITLNTKRYIRLTKDNECDNNPNTHHSNTCYQNCYLDEIVASCTCQSITFANFERYPDVDICYPYTRYKCEFNKTEIMKCQKECLPKCDEWIFENSVSMSRFDLDDRSSERDTAFISIHYETMQYTKIVEVEAFTIDMAVSNIGGQSGLWLGASFLTIIQAAYYIMNAILDKITSRKKNMLKNKP